MRRRRHILRRDRRHAMENTRVIDQRRVQRMGQREAAELTCRRRVDRRRAAGDVVRDRSTAPARSPRRRGARLPASVGPVRPPGPRCGTDAVRRARRRTSGARSAEEIAGRSRRMQRRLTLSAISGSTGSNQRSMPPCSGVVVAALVMRLVRFADDRPGAPAENTAWRRRRCASDARQVGIWTQRVPARGEAGPVVEGVALLEQHLHYVAADKAEAVAPQRVVQRDQYVFGRAMHGVDQRVGTGMRRIGQGVTYSAACTSRASTHASAQGPDAAVRSMWRPRRRAGRAARGTPRTQATARRSANGARRRVAPGSRPPRTARTPRNC